MKKIVQLTPSDIGVTADLFCDCFIDDHYYKKLHPDIDERRKILNGSFREQLLFCINEGYCYGIFEEKLIAFIICFDYNRVKNEQSEAFKKIFGYDETGANPSRDRLHKRMSELEGKTVYCLSLAVDPSYRSRGLAAALIDFVVEKFADCNIASDVSNTSSLSIYEKRNFTKEKLDTDYTMVLHRAGEKASVFECAPKVKLLVPDTEELDTNGIEYDLLKSETHISGYRINEGEICCFERQANALAAGSLLELCYAEYLKYQRAVNLSVCAENERADFVFLSADGAFKPEKISNPVLHQMLETRRAEWSIVPDVYVSIPVMYSDFALIEAKTKRPDNGVSILLENLEFRTRYEMGINSKYAYVDELSDCKMRISRHYLGKIKVQIETEIILEHYDELGDPIGNANYVDLYISLDTKSNSAVLSWYSLSLPFLMSHYFDNIMRNQIMVINDGVKENLFDYLAREFGVIKKGTPKMFAVIPKDKGVLTPGQTASLLAAETIYPDGENFGTIIDAEILDIVNSEKGKGQYDRAFVCAYRNVVLQFTPDFRGLVSERIAEEAITQFYIELIMFQEAAVGIADAAMVKLFASETKESPVEFLKNVEAIYDDYCKTIAFWDIQVNYPTSQKSIEMLREAFGLRRLIENMKRNQESLDKVFDTKSNRLDREEAKRTDTALAVISFLTIFSACMDFYSYIGVIGSGENYAGFSLVQIILSLLMLVVGIAISLPLIAKILKSLFGRRK